MKLDNKYFVPFIVISAVIFSLFLAWFTIQTRRERQQAFIQHINQKDSLKYVMMPAYIKGDSLSVQSFNDKYVMLDFWATWTAAFSKKSHEQLGRLVEKYPNKLEVIVAVVQDKPKKVKDYIQQHRYAFHYVRGTKVFEKFGLPGVPTLLFYSPEGELLSIFTGRADAARLDSLKTMLSDG